MNQQSVFLVHYPFTHFRETKLRPALILSKETFNRAHAFFVLCPISSQQSLPEYETKIEEKDFSGRLKTASYIRCDNLMSVQKELIVDEIEKVSPSLFKQALSKIKQNFE